MATVLQYSLLLLCVQAKFLELHMAKELDQFSWSMCAAVALKNLSWIVIIMVWAFPHVDTGKMLEWFAKVRYLTIKGRIASWSKTSSCEFPISNETMTCGKSSNVFPYIYSISISDCQMCIG